MVKVLYKLKFHKHISCLAEIWRPKLSAVRLKSLELIWQSFSLQDCVDGIDELYQNKETKHVSWQCHILKGSIWGQRRRPCWLQAWQMGPRVISSGHFKFIYLFIYLFLAVLGLHFCARAFSSCGERGPLFIAVRGPFTVAASLVAEHRLQTRRLSNCGSRA